MFRTLKRLAAYRTVLPKGRRNRTDLTKYLVRRPAIMAAVGAYETAVLFSNKVDLRMKYLAGVRTSSRVGCPF